MSSIYQLISTLVDAAVGARITAGVAYRARIVSQKADGTLDVLPDNAAVAGKRGLSNVRIVYGDPGTRAKVRPGGFCYVEFAEGDRSKPIVRGFEPGAIDELTITADRVRLADGDLSLARRGDLVVMQLPTNVNASANAWTPVPNPSPTAKVYGIIVSGSAKVTSA